MSVEGFFNHPLLVWEWFAFAGVTITLRAIIQYVWKRGKKKGREEFDEYKKWETVFKEEKRLKE